MMALMGSPRASGAGRGRLERNGCETVTQPDAAGLQCPSAFRWDPGPAAWGVAALATRALAMQVICSVTQNLARIAIFARGRFSAVFRLDGALPPTRSLWNSVEVASTDPYHGPEASLLLYHGGPDFFSTF